MFHWCLRSCRGTCRSEDGLPSSLVTGFACLCCRHRGHCRCSDRNQQLDLLVPHEAPHLVHLNLGSFGQRCPVSQVCHPAVLPENHSDFSTLLRTSLHVVVLVNCVTVPPSLCIKYIPQPNDFSNSVKAQSRILSHALSGLGTRQLAYMTSPGQQCFG